LPEFFIVIFAPSAGALVVAPTSLLGSIFANALFVLGLAIVVGAWVSRDGVMRFHPRLPKDNAILMLLASFLIVILGISAATGDKASHHVKAISIVGAVALLVTYGVWLVDYIRSDAGHEPQRGAPRVSMSLSLALLAIAGVGAAFAADWFVTALSPAMARIGVPKAFAGLVVVGLAGNAVENTTGVVLAAKGRSDPAIAVLKNAVAQITALLLPALVLVSLPFTTDLTFAIVRLDLRLKHVASQPDATILHLADPSSNRTRNLGALLRRQLNTLVRIDEKQIPQRSLLIASSDILRKREGRSAR